MGFRMKIIDVDVSFEERKVFVGAIYSPQSGVSVQKNGDKWRLSAMR